MKISPKTKEELEKRGAVDIQRMSIREAVRKGIPVMAHVQKIQRGAIEIIIGINENGFDISLKGMPEIEAMK